MSAQKVYILHPTATLEEFLQSAGKPPEDVKEEEKTIDPSKWTYEGAKKLLKLSDKAFYNDKDQFVYNNVVIPDTNIIKLMEFLFNPSFGNEKVQHVNLFLKYVLEELKAPDHLVVNTKAKNFLKPGQLVL